MNNLIHTCLFDNKSNEEIADEPFHSQLSDEPNNIQLNLFSNIKQEILQIQDILQNQQEISNQFEPQISQLYKENNIPKSKLNKIVNLINNLTLILTNQSTTP